MCTSVHVSDAQINMNDSTVQVIGYWYINETQKYTVSDEKLKIEDGDTTSRDYAKYMVDITVVDSTANSYTIDWFYHDYDIKTDNEFLKKITALVEDMKVTIITDELGVFIKVVNWKDIRDYIFKATKMLKRRTRAYLI